MTRNPHYRDLLGKSAWGGSLYKTRAGRIGRRPVATTHSMHFVLRSAKARGPLSFWRHKQRIRRLLEQSARKHGIHLHGMANVGNHIHLHAQVSYRRGYVRFIRAITSAIATVVKRGRRVGRFWDQRPFSRVVYGRRAFYRVRDYVDVNELEGMGLDRASARYWIAREYDLGQRHDSG